MNDFYIDLSGTDGSFVLMAAKVFMSVVQLLNYRNIFDLLLETIISKV
jgi:hypothetical protein